MSNDVEIRINSVDNTSEGFKSATKEAGKYGNSLGAVGEKADNSERNLIGLHDVIDGTATIMEGPGKQGLVAYIQGWADLAGGIAPLLISLSQVSLAKTKDIAITIAHSVAQKAAAVASGIWTAAQWLLNIALDANPIGLIILAIAALIAIIVLIATKTTWFQSIWKVTWDFLKGVGEWFAGPFAHFFTDAYHAIMDGVDKAGRWIREKFDAVVGFVTGIPGRLAAIGSGMWNFVKDSFRSAINWVIGRWNNLHFSIPSFDVFGYHTPGFTLNLPDIPYLAAGGIVPATPGGRLVVAGEGGEDEAVIPLSRLGNVGSGGKSLTMTFTGNSDGAVATLIKHLLRTNQIVINDSTGAPVTVY